jgi:hypothetical protein
LELVADIEPEAVVVLRALLLQNGLDTGVAAITAALGACTVGSR